MRPHAPTSAAVCPCSLAHTCSSDLCPRGRSSPGATAAATARQAHPALQLAGLAPHTCSQCHPHSMLARLAPCLRRSNSRGLPRASSQRHPCSLLAPPSRLVRWRTLIGVMGRPRAGRTRWNVLAGAVGPRWRRPQEDARAAALPGRASRPRPTRASRELAKARASEFN
jgi:hypothetical protein